MTCKKRDNAVLGREFELLQTLALGLFFFAQPTVLVEGFDARFQTLMLLLERQKFIVDRRCVRHDARGEAEKERLCCTAPAPRVLAKALSVARGCKFRLAERTGDRKHKIVAFLGLADRRHIIQNHADLGFLNPRWIERHAEF